MIFGEFLHNNDKPIRNTLVGEGVQLILQDVFQKAAVLPATNFYVGLSNAAAGYSDNLATIAAGEIAGNGYARQPLVRSGAGWTVELVNGLYRARSAIATFTASANWSSPYSRMFITDVVSGTSGKLYAVSGPTPSPINALAGAGPQVSYVFNVQG